MKTIIVFVPPEVSRAIKIAAATHDSTVQNIGHGAMVEWLARYDAGGKQVVETINNADLRTKGAQALLRTDRENLKTLVVFVPPEVAQAIKIAAATHLSTVQHIGQRAVLEWLDRYKAGGEQAINTIKVADLLTKGSRALSSKQPAVRNTSKVTA